MSRKTFTLGELCTIEKGSTGILKAIPGKYPLVVTAEERKSHNEYQFDGEAVIIPLVSGTGHGHASIKRIHFQTGKFALGSILCAIVPKDKSKLSAEYLYYFLDLNRENELVGRMRGMANVTLPIREIAKIEIPLPKLDDQIAFVEMYKLLGKKSVSLSYEFECQLNLVKKIRQQILQDAIKGKLAEQNLDDEPASILLQKIKTEKKKLLKEKKIKKEKELAPITSIQIPFDIPENWSWCRLGEVVTQYQNGVSSRGTSSETKSIVIRLADIENTVINILSPREIHLPINIINHHQLLNTDILVTRVNGSVELVGNFNYVGNQVQRVIACDHFIRMRINTLVSAKYIYYLGKSSLIRSPLETNFKTTAGQKTINQNHLNNLMIPLPPVRQQELIVLNIEKTIGICDRLENEIFKSQQRNEQLIQQVLKEALNKKDIIPVSKNEKYKTLLLATEIVWQLNQQQTLGRIKLQKLIYLCERTQQMNLPVNFLKWAMGPYDPELQKYIEKELAERKWFGYNEDEPLKFKPLENAGGHKADFDNYFANDKTAVNNLIQLFENARSAKIEIVATLFFCWEEIRKNNQLVNDATLLKGFYEFSEKKKKYTPEKVIESLRWMENAGIMPQA